MRAWNTDDAADLYGIRTWGKDFLRIGEKGDLVVAPQSAQGAWVNLPEVVAEIRRRGVELPLLLRFPDILQMSVGRLVSAFEQAFTEYEYKGKYRGVYPIKVNQQRHLVEDLVRLSAQHHLGLEAGSKSELLIVLALLEDPEALIICNGYKDAGYIETAVLAQKLGRNPIIVVEKPSELPIAIEVGKRLGVKPMLGLRAKLAARGSGRWEGSTGDSAKFGLTVEQMVDAVAFLQANDALDTLRLLHFHIGSQVTAIRSFKDALKEAARLYVELCKLGAPLDHFDVGGGLGVDYDGSQTNFHSSVNYSPNEYASHVVSAIREACDEHGFAHPNIVTEAGRAMVASSSVLVFDVVGVSGHTPEDTPVVINESDPELLHELAQSFETLSLKNYQEAWHDALEDREEILYRFNLGLVDIQQRAKGERLFWKILRKIDRVTRELTYVPDDVEALRRYLADIYYCNFSVFQSVPDAWAIGQLFPVVPIHRLNERPTHRAVLADLTCDSDGKLTKFIDLHDVKDWIDLHDWTAGSTYMLGIFLVGAYQEILGDMHNLFGDTNAVHVRLGEGGRYVLDHVVEGDTVNEVLGYVQYQRDDLVRRVRAAAETALTRGTITYEESSRLLKAFQAGLEDYTYLASDAR